MPPLSLFVKFLHIAAALWLTAGVFSSAVVRARARRSTDLGQQAFGFRILWRLHVVYTLPGLIVSGLIGFYLVTMIGYDWGSVWVVASSLLYLAMFLWTLFAITPPLSRASRAAEDALASDDARAEFEILRDARLPAVLSDVNALVILVLVYLMVLRPT